MRLVEIDDGKRDEMRVIVGYVADVCSGFKKGFPLSGFAHNTVFFVYVKKSPDAQNLSG